MSLQAMINIDNILFSWTTFKIRMGVGPSPNRWLTYMTTQVDEVQFLLSRLVCFFNKPHPQRPPQSLTPIHSPTRPHRHDGTLFQTPAAYSVIPAIKLHSLAIQSTNQQLWTAGLSLAISLHYTKIYIPTEYSLGQWFMNNFFASDSFHLTLLI